MCFGTWLAALSGSRRLFGNGYVGGRSMQWAIILGSRLSRSLSWHCSVRGIGACCHPPHTDFQLRRSRCSLLRPHCSLRNWLLRSLAYPFCASRCLTPPQNDAPHPPQHPSSPSYNTQAIHQQLKTVPRINRKHGHQDVS
jgi:hypothetical protein